MSTKTIEAIEEIKAILRKHDLAGIVQVQDGESSTFLRIIDPSWSCAHFEHIPGEETTAVAVRMRASKDAYGSVEARDKAITATVGMFFGFAGQSERDLHDMKEIIGTLVRQFPNIEFWEKFIQPPSESNEQS